MVRQAIGVAPVPLGTPLLAGPVLTTLGCRVNRAIKPVPVDTPERMVIVARHRPPRPPIRLPAPSAWRLVNK